MLFLELRIATVLFACFVATITDIKKGLIYDKITLPAVGFGIILDVLDFNLFNFIIPLFVFIFFASLYYLGKIGGGDVKLFTAASLLLPFYNNQIFIILALFFSALFSIVFISVFYTIKYAKTGIDFQKNKKNILQAFLLALALIICLTFTPKQPMLFVFIPMLFALPFLAFHQGIKERFFLKYVPVSALGEDEIIAKEFFENRSIFKTKGIITEEDKIKLKQMNIEKVPVYQGLPPFAPFFLLGVILALIFPDFLSTLYFIPY